MTPTITLLGGRLRGTREQYPHATRPAPLNTAVYALLLAVLAGTARPA
jgi:hypothetical protein